MGGDHRSRLTGHREAMLTLIAYQPDLTLREIRSALIERHGVTVGLATVSRFLAAHNITLKKKACTPPSNSVLMWLRPVGLSFAANRHWIRSVLSS
jgi:transposase